MKYINFYNNQRFHSSLSYQTPDDVYFGNNSVDINSVCKIDKELIFKLFLCQSILNFKKEIGLAA